ncbi:MAG: YraN family protein [Bacteroidetes bacterium]|nr:MAG: YraN family protein [Bacteroidota bacterium]RLD76884.1 MAG: YraN family protein [Bacteroidota bacterium]
MAEHNELGKSGEDYAYEYLLKKGFEILEKNWRHSKDEVDMIAMHNNYLVIIEVKTRSNLYFGEPQIFVNKRKQAYMIRAANAYIMKNDIHLETRFDIVSVILNGSRMSIKHIEDAFYPTL